MTAKKTAPVSAAASKLASVVKPKATDSAPHLVVKAGAGCGKTTTLIGGLQCVQGIEPHIIIAGTNERRVMIPSVQQAKVWDCMKLSAGKVRTIGMCAFNKSIAVEMGRRVPAGVDAMTLHSLGNRAVNNGCGKLKMLEGRVDSLIEFATGTDIWELRRTKTTMLQATKRMVNLCKMNLTDPTPDELDRLSGHYEVEMNGSRSEVYDLVPRVLELCKDVRRDGAFDFDDMVWLPVVLNLPVYRYDLLLVDESQDLNRCQQELAKRAGSRLILCGDPNQAIYGFAGADSQAMSRMETELKATDRGCETIPLMETRRCGKEIVKEAQKIVPDLTAHETNSEGKISFAQYTVDDNGNARPPEKTYLPTVKAGDMILCRVNAPLVSQCFKLLKLGVKANIQGRDVGQGLISTIKKMKASTIPDLIEKLCRWLDAETAKENAKKFPSESRLIALADRYDCIVCFTDGQTTPDGVVAKIEAVFTDNKDLPGVRLSSIHKAKGLEAHKVYFLQPKGAGCPHPMAKGEWQVEQEWNLRYVGITRAIEELVWVA